MIGIRGITERTNNDCSEEGKDLVMGNRTMDNVAQHVRALHLSFAENKNELILFGMKQNKMNHQMEFMRPSFQRNRGLLFRVVPKVKTCP